MAIVWSFGVQFSDLEKAQIAKSKINIIKLSDGSEVNLYKHIIFEQDNLVGYNLDLSVIGMQLAGNEKLFSNPYFYEIRNAFYDFIKNLDVNFSMALFECEGADKIIFNDLIEDINTWGLGEIMTSDSCIDLYVSDSVFQKKRILDGLVLSEQKLNELNIKFHSHFKPFKNGYFWLPIINI